jgi:hypothetical protein
VRQFELEVVNLKNLKENRRKSPELLAIDEIKSFYYLSNSEFELIKKKVIEMIKNGNFNIYEYISISRFFVQLNKDKPYLLTEYNINKILIDNIDKIKAKSSGNYYFEKDIESIIGNKKHFPNKLYAKFQQKLKTEFTEKSSKKTNELLEDIENKVIDQNYLHEIISKVGEMEIAKKLISNIKNRGFLDSFLRNLKRKYDSSNAGDFYTKEASKLNKIILSINKIIKDKEFESIDKVWVEEIIKILKIVIKHINSTKSNN